MRLVTLLAMLLIVLLYVAHLEISQLSKLFAAVIKFAREGFNLLMDNLVGTDIATLGKGLATNVTAVRAFSSMTPLVGLQMVSCLFSQ